MTIYYINTGSSANKGDGDTLRTAFNKINSNFEFLSTATGALPNALYNGTWTLALSSTGSVTLNNSLFVSGNTDWANIGNITGDNGPLTIAIGQNAGRDGQNTGSIAIGVQAGGGDGPGAAQGSYAVAIGVNAGGVEQGGGAIAIGLSAGQTNQGINTVAIGVAAAGKPNAPQGDNAIAIGFQAGNDTQGQFSVAVGQQAGEINQGATAIAVGISAGQTSQGGQAVALGYAAGLATQGLNAVAVGCTAGATTQGINAVAVGYSAGATTQGQYAVAVGYSAGATTQGDDSVAIGNQAAQSTQGSQGVAIGLGAGQTNQGYQSVAIGPGAGASGQGQQAIAIGQNAGENSQSTSTIAIGVKAGWDGQSLNAIAVGYNTGYVAQGNSAVAIGQQAGQFYQGSNAVAIGALAGLGSANYQANNTIILNATGVEVGGVANQTDSFYVAPIRSDVTATNNTLYYNTSTFELTYGPGGATGPVFQLTTSTGATVTLNYGSFIGGNQLEISTGTYLTFDDPDTGAPLTLLGVQATNGFPEDNTSTLFLSLAHPIAMAGTGLNLSEFSMSTTTSAAITVGYTGEYIWSLNTGSTGTVQITSGIAGSPSYTWTFGSDGILTFPTGGRISSAGKGGTMLDGGFGGPTSLTNFYASGNYAACVTGYSNGRLYITTYNDGGADPSKEWAFDNNGNLTLPDNSKINSGGINVRNSAEIKTTINRDGSDTSIINTSEIALQAGNGGISAQVYGPWTGGADGSGGPTLVYAGVENLAFSGNGPGFAGFVAIDPAVTSNYSVAIDDNSKIFVNFYDPVTTTGYVAALGVLTSNIDTGTGKALLNGIAVTSTQTALTGNAGTSISTDGGTWQFGSDGVLTFPDSTVQTTAYLGPATTSTLGGVIVGSGIELYNGVISVNTSTLVGPPGAPGLNGADGAPGAKGDTGTSIAFTVTNISYFTNDVAYLTSATVGQYVTPFNTGTLVAQAVSAQTVGTLTNLIINGQITTPVGSNANLVLNPDGLADVIITTATQILMWATNTSISTTTGALVVTGGVGVGGTVTANKFVGDGSSLTNLTVSQAGNILGVGNNVTLVAGSYSYVFDNTGTFTMPTNGDIVMPGANANLTVGGNISGNGSQLTGVATKTSGSWTLFPGANTVSITVTPGGNYQMWVNGNIPNGIVTWNATVSTSNTNVPVVGVQYGWYYAGGNALVLTSIPNQIVGTAGGISTATVATTTSNVFIFGITNNSGTPQVINWGYVTL